MPSRLTKKEAMRGLSISKLIEWRDRSQKDFHTIETVRADYTKKYPNTWIAVYEGEVFGPKENAEDLRTLLKERSIEPGESNFAYLNPDYLKGLIL